MINKIKEILKKIFLKERYDSESYRKYLIRNGVKVGVGTFFFGPKNTSIDIGRKNLIQIGEYCKITGGVTILSHDYSRSVLRIKYGELLAEAQETIIGDNVFIGINTTILMGTTIGNNVIIGANSLVKGKFPDDVVIAGNPAKVICTLEEYYLKRKDNYINEAKFYAELFYKNEGRKPTMKDMGQFYPIFCERNLDVIKENNININLSGDNMNDVVEKFLNSKPLYNGLEEFLDLCNFN